MQCNPTHILRHFLTLAATALLAFVPLAPAWADAPLARTQVPGYYRTQLGQFEITALYDGNIDLDTKLLKNIDEKDLQPMLARMFVGNPKMQTAVNGYLINTGKHLVHAHAVQFARPDVAIEFDIDPQQAVATRRAILQAMAESKSLVAGMHLPFPGIGHVRLDSEGCYSWVPAEFGQGDTPSLRRE